MSYYSRYSWYQPYEPRGPQYAAPAQQQPQQQQQQQQAGPNYGNMMRAYQNYNASLTPAYSSASANPMLSGANYSSTAQMSPVSAGDPFTQSSLAQTSGTGFDGALSGNQGALSGQGSFSTAGGQSSWMSGMGPWALAAVIGMKAEDSRKHGVSYEDQMKNPSRNIQADMDRWEVDETLNKTFGGDMGGMLSGGMRGGLDLASGDFGNAWDYFKDSDPILKGLRSIF